MGRLSRRDARLTSVGRGAGHWLHLAAVGGVRASRPRGTQCACAAAAGRAPLRRVRCEVTESSFLADFRGRRRLGGVTRFWRPRGCAGRRVTRSAAPRPGLC
ncbi:hypothetical protein NN561_003332 [Cricetulus griseus]